MIRPMKTIVAMAVLAGAAPGFAQTLPGVNAGQVNRTIPGTPVSPETGVNPATGVPITPTPPRPATPAPVVRNGLTAPGTPSIAAANRPNGTYGQQGVSGVRGVAGVRAVGSPPANQRPGAQRPALVWQP